MANSIDIPSFSGALDARTLEAVDSVQRRTSRYNQSLDPAQVTDDHIHSSLPTPPLFTAASPHETYIGVQLLRGLAAMLIVVFHAGVLLKDHFPELGDRFVLSSGASGVDIFFPISGFVMLISSRALLNRADGWKIFVERRLIRIVPLYWLFTTFKIATVIAIPALALHTHITGWHTIASYLFISAENSEGFFQPIVPVGWTLNYEMFFYAIFALVIFLHKPLLRTITALLVSAVVLSFIIPVENTPLAVFGPLILEFGAGLWVAQLALSGKRSSTGAAAMLLVTGLTALFAVGFLPQDIVEQWRVLFWGIPGIILLYASVSLEPWFSQWKWNFGRLLGDASYSIYLSHGFVLPIFGIAAIKLGLHGMSGAALTFALAIAASMAVGVVCHLYLERPMTQILLAWSKSRRSRTITAIA